MNWLDCDADCDADHKDLLEDSVGVEAARGPGGGVVFCYCFQHKLYLMYTSVNRWIFFFF